VRAQAEIEPAGQPFTGQPTVSGNPVSLRAGRVGRQPLAFSNLTDGALYHWRARAMAADGHPSAWSVGGVFGVSTTAPTPPQLAATNVKIDGWSSAGKLLFRWIPMGGTSPVAAFQYAIVRHGVDLAAMRPRWTTTGATLLSVPKWREGRWELLLRTRDEAGRFSAPSIIPFSLAHHAPAAPTIVLATPRSGAAANTKTPTLSWTSGPDVVPLRGYQYAILPGSVSAPAQAAWTDTVSNTLALAGLGDGQWTVFLHAVNAVGVVSPPVRWSFTLDRQAPKLSVPVVSDASFTAPVERLRVKMTLTKTATVSYRIYIAGHVTPLTTRSLGVVGPGPIHGLNWNGTTTPHHLAAAGNYRMVVQAVDEVGNLAKAQMPLITVQTKRILLSVSKDALWAYDGNKLVYHILVSNGGPDTPTLPGIFHVEAKIPNMVFHSPWPKGSPLYYAPSPTNYAMLYNANGGYFIHDSPWRSNYGPGSNSLAGTPGGNFTGTHGCTNVPLSSMAVLYAWADVGTLIQIVP
jgi:lipoprotein-anchoring transpeptidase ErfK/SrfK